MNKSKRYHSRMFPVTCSCDHKQNATVLLSKPMRTTGVSQMSSYAGKERCFLDLVFFIFSLLYVPIAHSKFMASL